MGIFEDETLASVFGELCNSHTRLESNLERLRQTQPDGALETLEWDLDVLKDVISSLESKLSKMRQNGDLPS